MKAILFSFVLWQLSFCQSEFENGITKCNSSAGSVHGLSAEMLSGKKASMSKYNGSVVLLVNVATYCGYTEQYIDFNHLLTFYNRSLYIVGFPCNQFLLQEPGCNSEILNGLKYVRPGNGFTLSSNLHIFGKVEVNGDNAHKMFKFLKDACPPTSKRVGKKENMFWNPIEVNDISWNFEKFIIDKNGRPLYRINPAVWDHGNKIRPLLEDAFSA